MTCGRDVRDVSRGPSDENGGAKGMVPGAAETRIEQEQWFVRRTASDSPTIRSLR